MYVYVYVYVFGWACFLKISVLRHYSGTYRGNTVFVLVAFCSGGTYLDFQTVDSSRTIMTRKGCFSKWGDSPHFPFGWISANPQTKDISQKHTHKHKLPATGQPDLRGTFKRPMTSAPTFTSQDATISHTPKVHGDDMEHERTQLKNRKTFWAWTPISLQTHKEKATCTPDAIGSLVRSSAYSPHAAWASPPCQRTKESMWFAHKRFSAFECSLPSAFKAPGHVFTRPTPHGNQVKPRQHQLSLDK